MTTAFTTVQLNLMDRGLPSTASELEAISSPDRRTHVQASRALRSISAVARRDAYENTAAPEPASAGVRDPLQATKHTQGPTAASIDPNMDQAIVAALGKIVGKKRPPNGLVRGLTAAVDSIRSFDGTKIGGACVAVVGAAAYALSVGEPGYFFFEVVGQIAMGAGGAVTLFDPVTSGLKAALDPN